MNMQKITLLNKLIQDFPELSFTPADDFVWKPKNKEILYNPNETSNFNILLLHEVAHYLAGHQEYGLDIELIKMEAEAWNIVNTKLAPKYEIMSKKEYQEDQLDSYRDWLHKRSLCPNCNINGFQIDKSNYKCPVCNTLWKVNQAKFTSLRRKIINKKPHL